MRKTLLLLLFFIFSGFLTLNLQAEQQVKLVDLQKLDPTIVVELVYATDDNFTGQAVYPAGSRAYLREEVAEKLLRVQKKLNKIGFGLKVWDAYRPLSVQYKFWEIYPVPGFVADPKTGSNHNRGAAVDVTLVDSEGKELSMPTKFDDFSEKAGRDYYDLPAKVIKNRQILEDYMVSEGFVPLRTEWWHFDDEHVKNYPILDIPIDKVK